MANLAAKAVRSNFRYVPNIDKLDESQLESHGYYKGYPCPHRHRIRDKEGIGVITAPSRSNQISAAST